MFTLSFYKCEGRDKLHTTSLMFITLLEQSTVQFNFSLFFAIILVHRYKINVY